MPSDEEIYEDLMHEILQGRDASTNYKVDKQSVNWLNLQKEPRYAIDFTLTGMLVKQLPIRRKALQEQHNAAIAQANSVGASAASVARWAPPLDFTSVQKLYTKAYHTALNAAFSDPNLTDAINYFCGVVDDDDQPGEPTVNENAMVESVYCSIRHGTWYVSKLRRDFITKLKQLCPNMASKKIWHTRLANGGVVNLRKWRPNDIPLAVMEHIQYSLVTVS
jgi:hypothetical protein